MGEPVRLAAFALGDEQRVPLRLTVTRGVLGIELYEPIELGPIDVAQLSITLPNLKFPLDLSGGVPHFRNRRGELEHAVLKSTLTRLARYFESRLGDVLGALVRPVAVFARPQGIGVGLVAHGRALAFDLLWVPDERHARFVVSDARGVGLPGAALGFALRALDCVFAGLGVRNGRVLSIPDAGASLARVLFPAVGARAPSARRVRFGALSIDGNEARVELDSSFAPGELTPQGTRALELARLVASADDALSCGAADEARAGYLLALEQAPRQPELVRLIADIDLQVPERAEAALGMVVESLPATRAGITGAELLWRIGDFDGARQALSEAAGLEHYAPLAALLWCRCAERDTSALERRNALDRAVALSPGLELPRSRRFAARLGHGDSIGALADAEHLEAMTAGARGKHEGNLQAARAFFAAGFVREARRCFERALRYAPDDARATAGLARALLESGQRERATTLLARAVALSERNGQPDADALIDLAMVLASDLKDLPQAIARARQVSASSPRYVEARRLEARWRADLGDIAGASLCFGRMREAIELSVEPPVSVAQFLLEASEFEHDTQRDVLAAERHLAIALRVAPRDARIAERYRQVAAEAALVTRAQRRG
ncbi:MAG TPA: tetratricopeptide repeat protein [Polyangiaceae bacterium]|nr:tetratricopeptide repeat protein [Polyangiaceae bacterium]